MFHIFRYHRRAHCRHAAVPEGPAHVLPNHETLIPAGGEHQRRGLQHADAYDEGGPRRLPVHVADAGSRMWRQNCRYRFARKFDVEFGKKFSYFISQRQRRLIFIYLQPER